MIAATESPASWDGQNISKTSTIWATSELVFQDNISKNSSQESSCCLIFSLPASEPAFSNCFDNEAFELRVLWTSPLYSGLSKSCWIPLKSTGNPLLNLSTPICSASGLTPVLTASLISEEWSKYFTRSSYRFLWLFLKSKRYCCPFFLVT